MELSLILAYCILVAVFVIVVLIALIKARGVMIKSKEKENSELREEINRLTAENMKLRFPNCNMTNEEIKNSYNVRV